MSSAIDPTKPTEGKAYTADVRDNFAAAASEIEALQTALNGMQAAIALLQANLATAQADIAALQAGQADLTQIQADIVTLKARQMAANSAITANPPNTGSSAYVLAVDGLVFTPQTSARGIVLVDGELGNTSNASESGVQLFWGTGAPPPAGTAISATNGQPVGASATMLSARSGDYDPFALAGLITGLTPQTPLWIGVGLRALSGTATLSELAVTAFEVLDPLP